MPLLKGCLEIVLVFISLKLSEMILSFRYIFWYQSVWLFGLGFGDKEIIQKYSPQTTPSPPSSPYFWPYSLAHFVSLIILLGINLIFSFSFRIFCTIS